MSYGFYPSERINGTILNIRLMVSMHLKRRRTVVYLSRVNPRGVEHGERWRGDMVASTGYKRELPSRY